MKIAGLSLAALLLGALSFTAPAAQASSLYQDLGEQRGIELLMEEMLFNIADDRRIRHHFVETDMAHLHQMLSEQICELAGGPCVYSGEEMVESHTGLDISRGDFNALVEALQLAMDDNDIPVGVQNRLLALLAPMHHEIVNL
ncbi:MAG: group 1 truncated hemoglobin [Idiomarina sp.]|nr:group 1 truncated hemoglobin [Idiomarina sp.]